MWFIYGWQQQWNGKGAIDDSKCQLATRYRDLSQCQPYIVVVFWDSVSPFSPERFYWKGPDRWGVSSTDCKEIVKHAFYTPFCKPPSAVRTLDPIFAILWRGSRTSILATTHARIETAMIERVRRRSRTDASFLFEISLSDFQPNPVGSAKSLVHIDVPQKRNAEK